jgi:hypothetical protein
MMVMVKCYCEKTSCSCSCYCQIMLAIKIKCFNKMLYILSAVEKRNWVGVFYYSVNEMEMLLVHLK